MGPRSAEGVVMLAELQVRPDRLAEFLDYTTRNLPISRAYPGNLQFDILLDDAAPQTVIFYEVWESPSAQQAYMAWRIAEGDLTRLMSMLAAPPRFTALRRVAV